MTGFDELLTAVAKLPEPFTVEDLIVAAWQANPERWGMKGHPHPCTNRVKVELFKRGQAGGILSRGYLEPLGTPKNRTYRLTDVGRARLAELNGHASAGNRLPGPLDRLVARCLASPIYTEGPNTAGWWLAQKWWGMAHGVNRCPDLLGHIEQQESLWRQLEQLVEGQSYVLSDGRTVDAGLVRELRNLDRAVWDKFQKRVEVAA